MKDYKEIFQKCINNLKSKNADGISTLEKAFLFAESKHQGQTRISGEPYIIHPVEVMETLEKLDFDTDVLSAALLHDIIEDCHIDKKELANNFNLNISQIVDAVSEFQNQNEDWWQTKLKTYQKLVSIGKHNLFSFFIKFSDRYNNLKTLSVFPRYKQLEKVKQTEKFVLPLARLLKSNYFDKQISSLCYYYSLDDSLRDFLGNKYKFYIDATQKLANKMVMDLQHFLQLKLSKSNYAKLKSLKVYPLTLLEVKDFILNYYDLKQDSEIKPFCFASVPLYELNFLLDDCEDVNKCFFELANQNDFKKYLTFCDFGIDEYSQYFIMENPQRVKFKVIITSPENYILRRNGSLQGVFSSLLEDDFEQKIETDYICVKTSTDEPIYLAKGATVLDFAFKIHKDFGFSILHAHLNGSPNKSPIWTKLSPNDKIVLEIARDEDGQPKNIAKIRWLAYTYCEMSRKALIKYFERLYE